MEGGLYLRTLSGIFVSKGLPSFSNLSTCFPNYLPRAVNVTIKVNIEASDTAILLGGNLEIFINLLEIV